MNSKERSNHWEAIYSKKSFSEVSWYQETPTTSLNLIQSVQIGLNDSIIDIGGGESRFTDHLIQLGYTDITLLDISQQAIDKSKERLANHIDKIDFIASDITEFKPQRTFKVWHDRAAFHFLTSPEDVQTYVHLAEKSIETGGYLILGTFDIGGPLKCSGIEIKQYDEALIGQTFGQCFKVIDSLKEIHPTPFDTEQKFNFVVLQKH